MLADAWRATVATRARSPLVSLNGVVKEKLSDSRVEWCSSAFGAIV